eukprot:NODE_1269_length_997_cov_174.781646_g975_i0.p2 GENE.NODE_1269_length_997_cov_174.781646_g975_i0~~NODE_1269_length_997_cov_174.781646_g975_i0.p2  ORF type:complete len:258 (+),score=54.21 NODE_1269_length_997_cov_174.781646_g975_i0:73-846(+)
MVKVDIIPLPNCDNYCYVILDPSTNTAGVIDPANPAVVTARLEQLGVLPGGSWKVLTTHHHADHAGGNNEIHAKYPEVPIYGGKNDKIASVTHPLDENDEFAIGNLKVQVINAPCHTLGHVLYYVTDPASPSTPAALFTGDTVFVAGVGKFFEGTPDMMHAALAKVKALPPTTQIYPGHEYTVKNLQFAAKVDPQNADVAAKIQWCSQNPITVPSSVDQELRINPFMRCDSPAIQQVTGSTDEIKCLGKLRELKNNA